MALKQKGPMTHGRRKAGASPLLTVTLHNLGYTVVALIITHAQQLSRGQSTVSISLTLTHMLSMS